MNLRTRTRIVTAALLLLVLLVVAGALFNVLPARAADTFQLPARLVPAGMATDHARERYWVLGSTPGRLRLTAVKAGVVEGEFVSQDSLGSPQALAYLDGHAYIGDIGGHRATVTVYDVTEPWPGTDILRAVAYPLSYPDGTHDAAALFVDGRRRIHLVTNGPGAGVYRAPAQLANGEPGMLERVADAPDGVTDAAALRDGRVVLRTQASVITVDPANFAVLGEAPAEPTQQGFALTEALTAGEVLLAAAADGTVSAVAVPGAAPAPSQPRPTPTPASPPGGTPPGVRPLEQTGTVLSLVAALVVAVLAGITVLARR
ncbi:MAG: hypothetical protein QM708_10780 [Propioniciclava sp.]|uniref:hypothetical protein n=1 Tax=Propioniciclava sp. TaxID=2038686 RepID=UPI0039E3A8E4